MPPIRLEKLFFLYWRQYPGVEEALLKILTVESKIIQNIRTMETKKFISI